MRRVFGTRPYLGPDDLRDLLQPSALVTHPGRVSLLLAEVAGRARGNTHARQGMRNYWWRVNRNFLSCYGYGKPYTWAGWPPVYGPHQWYQCGGRWLVLPEPHDNVPVLWGEFRGNEVQSSQWA